MQADEVMCVESDEAGENAGAAKREVILLGPVEPEVKTFCVLATK